MIGERHLIVVAPHPDDETFALGGTIYDHLRNGGTCEVVAVTAGESADERAGRASRRRMAERRRAERASAMVALGADGITITELHLPDRGVTAHAEALTRTLAELFARRGRRFRHCLVAAPWRNDPHADHIATEPPPSRQQGSPDRPVSRLRSGPGTDLTGDPGSRARALTISRSAKGALTAKRAALQCFASQLEPLPGGRGAVLPSDFVEAFSGTSEVILP